jgi:hypothetical protein
MMLRDQLPHLLAVKFWPPVTKLFFEGIAQRFHVPVFTKYQRDHQPVIARPNLSIRTMVAVEGTRRPSRDVRRGPGIAAHLGSKAGSVMLHVARAEQAAARDRLMTSSPTARSRMANFCLAGISDSGTYCSPAKLIGSPAGSGVKATRTLSLGSILSTFSEAIYSRRHSAADID